MARPTGSIQKRGNKFRARYRKGGVLYSKSFDRLEDAEAYLEAVDTAAPRMRNSPTFASLCRTWIEARARAGQLRHEGNELSLYRCVVEEWSSADTPLRAVKRRHVAEYVADLVRHGELSRQSIKHRLRLVRTLLDHAADLGKVPANVAIGVKVPRIVLDERRDKWTFLEQDEIDAVLAVEYTRADALAQRALFATAIYTGLRRSELWYLTRGNVVFGAHPHIRVRGPLKTPSARRDVPLLPQAIEPLRAWLESSNALHVWPSSTGGTRTGTNDAGWRDQVSWRTVRGERYRHTRPGVKSRAGISRHVRFHDLRHTCASHLMMGGWGVALTLEECRDWLGHSSTIVTQRYAHLSPAGVRDRVRRLRDHVRDHGKGEGGNGE